MLAYPNINPIAFHIGSWPVFWYGLMYLVGFLGGWGMLALRIRISSRGFTQDQVSDIVFYGALGAIIGGRLGYMLFYDGRMLLTDPLLVFQTWKGGMSFHGGLLGVLAAMMLVKRKVKKSFLELSDLISPIIPIGLGAGRIGNFINSELWGRVTDVPWGMIFPNAGPYPRHPSQLYEFALEGVVLFLILWTYSRKPRPVGAVSGLFAIGYGVFRCFVEFFRVPDEHIGYLAFGWLTEGQLLSLPLILVGVMLMYNAYNTKHKPRKKKGDVMKQYLDYLQHIMLHGVQKTDRTGVGIQSVFGYQMRFDLSAGFPLVTTKKCHTKSIVHELLWFLRGDTNVRYLQQNDVRIWNEWADENGDLGPVYGKQWRSWQGVDGQAIDQMSELVQQIKTNPDSRRLIVNAWNVSDLNKMALPPCHLLFQFYVANKKLSCQLYQRSADSFLGVPFNIASYSLLTYMIAEQCNLEVGDFVWTGGDCHIYLNHFEQVQEQLSRTPYPLPQLQFKRKPSSLFEYEYDDIEFLNYQAHPHIKGQVAV